MKNSNFSDLEQKALAKAQKRDNKKKPKMKVSGAAVKVLEKIIRHGGQVKNK